MEEALSITTVDSSHDPRAEDQSEGASQSTRTPRSKICGVCGENESKYKCSQCELRYCSVLCSKIHRETHPTQSRPPPVPKPTSAPRHPYKSIPLPGTLGTKQRRHPFDILAESDELRQLFLTFPRLRSQLRAIAAAVESPEEVGSNEMDNKENEDNHRRRGGGIARSNFKRSRAPWTPERGTLEGIKALRRAQDEYGRDGEGVQEYARLVLKIVEEEGLDATSLFQQETAAENARIVSQMLEADHR